MLLITINLIYLNVSFSAIVLVYKILVIRTISGQVIIQILPQPILDALQYLLPALFGALFTDRLLNSPAKLSLSSLPVIFIVKVLAVMGIFTVLPFGGGYASIIICVITCMILAKMLCAKKIVDESC